MGWPDGRRKAMRTATAGMAKPWSAPELLDSDEQRVGTVGFVGTGEQRRIVGELCPGGEADFAAGKDRDDEHPPAAVEPPDGVHGSVDDRLHLGSHGLPVPRPKRAVV